MRRRAGLVERTARQAYRERLVDRRARARHPALAEHYAALVERLDGGQVLVVHGWQLPGAVFDTDRRYALEVDGAATEVVPVHGPGRLVSYRRPDGSLV